MRLLATWASTMPAKASTNRPGRSPGRCTASSVATAPATRVMGSTAARVRTSQRDTGSRGRPVGGFVVRNTSTHAASRLWVGVPADAPAGSRSGMTALTSVMLTTRPRGVPTGVGGPCGAREPLWYDGPMAEEHDHTIDTGKGTFELSELGRLMPGMAEIMPLVGERVWKCYYAGKARNVPLARFQLAEAVNLLKKGAVLRPKYRDDVESFVAGEIAAVRQAIVDEDWD